MSDYSSMATLQNNSKPVGFAAAVQRARLVAAKIEGGGSKRPLEDGPEPSSKKLASVEYSPPPMRELVNNIVNHRGRENAQHQEQGMPPMPRSMGGGGGGGGGGGLGITEEIILPGPKVGLIIGKSGKTIKQLQEQSGAKMVVIQDGPNTEYEKPLRISGDPQKVEHAKQLVYELLQDKDSNQGGGGNRFDDSYQEQGNGFTSAEVLVPKIAVGVVIGRGGDMIKKIQSDSGCRVQFHQERDEGPGDKRCYLQGQPHQVDQARQMIEDLINSVNLAIRSGRGRPGNKNGGRDRDNQQQWQDNQPEVRVNFSVSNAKCGLIIGRGGEVIKQINAQSGAHCELDRRVQNQDNNNRTFFIKGHPEAVENCKRIIMEKVGMPVNFIPDGGSDNGSNNGGGGNGGGGGGGGDFYGGGPPAWGYNPHWHHQQPQPPQPQVQINPSTGQPDYSQQWIDYYRSLGMIKEAEVIEQQAKSQQQMGGGNNNNSSPAGGPGPAPTGGPGPAPSPAPSGGQPTPDYSAQWADYYRSIGKVKEAEAIEAQIKMKQQASAAPAAPPASQASPGLPPYGQYPGYAPAPAPAYPYPYPYGQGPDGGHHQ
ncbi:far upstream element-binding protein 2 isoform X3 [Leptidea sinapis]|uniref:far upstream element-binding protein 2 isoform X3 n=1 Tax=Leptidea sinapis TaxID=189913 RepID=UPI00214119B9|nr:far upstream element-binding protein 2 isoform X3 [Leptidea sinapis]